MIQEPYNDSTFSSVPRFLFVVVSLFATGTPRQATGPPRSGAGVGAGMLRGAGADTRRVPYVLY